ncbi:MAG: galactoside O-acetyltransferase [Idiomarina sp. T82-3]|uniref:acyltransferase n=1 Tax=Idiomarina TaxID=135575 RepID=UPI0007947802|nr:acyltransferase [Idiomarina sp. T82-3]KXS35302.1 MAG: galactoside O-acetyltransferase [Idiomarina sp. T82-3]
MGFLNKNELKEIGFKELGQNVFISSKASIYNAERISIGDNVRIDDFCVLSAGNEGIKIGRNVHVAVFSSLIGAEKITLGDFSNISSRVAIYSSSDDYSGASMTNPTIPDEFKNVHSESVRIGRHVIIGSGSVILPGIVIEDGCAIGALSLVNKSCKKFGLYSGIPAKFLKERAQGFLTLEKEFLNRV